MDFRVPKKGKKRKPWILGFGLAKSSSLLLTTKLITNKTNDMERLLSEHQTNSVRMNGRIYGKFLACIGGLYFYEYIEVTENNVYELLGY